MNAAPHNNVAIIGTGFGGVATAFRLRQAGVNDVVLVDRASDVGGVWRDNDYPGAAVDVESNLYSFSFAPNPNWHNAFAKQPELRAYLRDVTAKFDLRRQMVFDCPVERLDWDPAKQQWTLRTHTVNGPRATSSSPPARSPTRSSLSSPVATASTVRASTPRSGATTSTSPANASPSSAPARPPSSSSRPSSPLSGT
jgi:hypothetical protein